MKRMISAFAVLVVVAGAFAFTPKDQNYCLYQKSGSTCPLLARPDAFTIDATSGGTRFIKNEDANGNCSATQTFADCIQVVSYTTN